jgi:S1-C subfamily serine protease
MRIVVGCCIVLLMGCATTSDHGSLEETPLVDPAANGVTSGQATAETTTRPKGLVVLSRKDLVRVLDRGPRDFLSSIDEDALVDKGRFRAWIFRGWRDRRFADADLLPGDLIFRINGKPIEKPDQFMEVWESLRTASELVIDGERDGKARTLRYPIQN